MMAPISTNTEGGPLLAIDIGGTKVAWAVVESTTAQAASPAAEGVPLYLSDSGSQPTNAHEGGAVLGERVAEVARTVVAGRPDLTGVAIASAGVVDPESGSIISATETIPGWAGVPLGRLVSEATGLPCRVLNDVHAHGLGEALFGAGRGAESVFTVAVGTGIGGAFVRDGQVLFGAHNIAGHVGHVHHPSAAGMVCSCGRMSHLESIASGTGIADWYAKRGGEIVAGGAQVAARAAAGDALAQEVIAQAGEVLGEVLGSLANCFDPEVIVLTGSVTRLGEPWLERVRAGYLATAMNGVADTSLTDGLLGGSAPLLGAVAHFHRGVPSSN